MVLGHQQAVDAGGLGRPEYRPQVPGVLDLIQREEERGLPPARRDSEQITERGIAGTGHPRHHPLVMGIPGDRGELVTSAVRDLDALSLGQPQQLVKRRAATLREDRDLLYPPAPRAQELQHRVAAEERAALLLGGPRRIRAGLGPLSGHDWSFQVVPSRVSSRITPRRAISSRSRSASWKSR